MTPGARGTGAITTGKLPGVQKTYFPKEPPARSTVGISGLAKPEMLVEIEAVAVL